MNNIDFWNPYKQDWNEISVDVYQVAYQEAKDRFEDCASESESVTNKSFKIVTFYCVLAAFSVGIWTQKTPPIFLLVICGLLFCGGFYQLFLLLKPKQIYFRGLEPYNSMSDDLTDSEIKEFQKQCIYSRVVVLLQSKISGLNALNEQRASVYRRLLVITVFLIIAVAFGVALAISRL